MEAHLANALQPQLSMPQPLPRVHPPAITVGFVSPALEALERLETWIAWRLPGFDTPEECLKGQIQTPQRQLGRLGIELAYRIVIGPQRGEVFFLRRAGDRMALSAPGSTPLFQCGIVQLLMPALDRQHGSFLLGRGVQTIGNFAVDGFHAVHYH